MQLSPTVRASLEEEHSKLAFAARERRSVDLYARAALEGFLFGVIAGVCGKLLWDSARPALLFYPLALLDLLLLWDAVRRYRAGRTALARELTIEKRLREVRVLLGIDPPPARDRPPRSGLGAAQGAKT